MLEQNITVYVHTTVAGPDGVKLMPGKVVELEDNEYTRLLVTSGTVSLVDPPSLDPTFLEKGGYTLQYGYSYDELKKTAAVEEESKKVGMKVKVQKKAKPTESEEQQLNVVSEESSKEEGAMVEEETP